MAEIWGMPDNPGGGAPGPTGTGAGTEGWGGTADPWNPHGTPNIYSGFVSGSHVNQDPFTGTLPQTNDTASHYYSGYWAAVQAAQYGFGGNSYGNLSLWPFGPQSDDPFIHHFLPDTRQASSPTIRSIAAALAGTLAGAVLSGPLGSLLGAEEGSAAALALEAIIATVVGYLSIAVDEGPTPNFFEARREAARLSLHPNAMSSSGLPNWLEALRPIYSDDDYTPPLVQSWYDTMDANRILRSGDIATGWFQHSERVYFPQYTAEQLGDFASGRVTQSQVQTKSQVTLGATGLPGFSSSDLFTFGPPVPWDE